MRWSLLSLVGVLGVFLTGLSAANSARAAEPPKALAEAVVELSPSKHPGRVQQVVRDAETLAKLLGVKDRKQAILHAETALLVKAVDFDRHMIVAVSAGPVHGKLLRLDVTRLEMKKDELRVHWLIQRMLEKITDPLVHPARIVLVEKFEGDVTFAAPAESLR